ncbi:hypothetical protein OHS71_13955 [Streptomyces sp. NBC_00377]|uniref:hypothetical protein n=1 Tax=unclassified Streptomyces TaxID=2593676 RepID=UPI002E22A7C4|nr:MULTISPECIES: hypothetical protein [unclassified Streptomyces]
MTTVWRWAASANVCGPSAQMRGVTDKGSFLNQVLRDEEVITLGATHRISR